MERVCKNRIIIHKDVHWIIMGADKTSIFTQKANPFGLPLREKVFPRGAVEILSQRNLFMTHEITRQLQNRQRFLFFSRTKESLQILDSKPQTILLYKIRNGKKYAKWIIQVDPATYTEDLDEEISVKLIKVVQRL